MQVVEPLGQFAFVPHAALPKLMLPHRSPPPTFPVEQAGCLPFHALDRPRNREGWPRPDQRVPVIRQDDVTAQQELHPPPGFGQRFHHQRQFLLPQERKTAPQIDRDKEDSVADQQPPYPGHATMVATAKALFNYALSRAHGTRAVPWLPALEKAMARWRISFQDSGMAG